jgi:hypothetical protein
LISTITSIYWLNLRFTIQVFLFFITLLSLSLFKRLEIKSAVEYFSKFLLILLIFAVISSFLTFNFNFTRQIGVNPDGRELFLHFLTFSNSGYRFGSHLVIRPSGIYDEPGTFSFIICIISVLRYYLDLPLKRTILLLLLGFITLSYAHLLFTTVFIVSLLVSGKIKINYKNSLIFGLFLMFLVTFFLNSTVFEIINNFLLKRADFNSVDDFGGSRYLLMQNAISYLDINSFLFGLDPICIYDSISCNTKYGQLLDNPLSSLITRGMFASSIYYFFLFINVVKSFYFKRNFILFGVFLLALQRPSILLPGFDIYYALIILLCFNFFKLNEN